MCGWTGVTLGQRRQDPSSGGSLPTEVLWLSGLSVESCLLSLASGVTNWGFRDSALS